MDKIEKLYQKINAQLRDFCDKIKKIQQEKVDLRKQYEESVVLIENEVKQKKIENQEKEERLKAFINIARVHGGNLVDTRKAELYDVDLLSRLTVQINNASYDDEFARQLFSHASNQLRYVREENRKIEMWGAQERSKREYNYQMSVNEKEQHEEYLCEKILALFKSEHYKKLIEQARKETNVFSQNMKDGYIPNQYSYIGLGNKRVKLLFPETVQTEIETVSGELYDSKSKTVQIPFEFSIQKGSGLFIEYENQNENVVLNGIQNFLFNLLRYGGSDLKQICYIDPIRLNGSSLGCLQELSVGKKSIIGHIPTSTDEIRMKLQKVIDDINMEGCEVQNRKRDSMSKRVIVVHDFPRGYDFATVRLVQQLFTSALYYNINIIVTNNVSVKYTNNSDDINLVRTKAMNIKCKEGRFYIQEEEESQEFIWYTAPMQLPVWMKEKYINEKDGEHMGNDYDQRVGIDQPIRYQKGIRRLEKIPYGVDEDGNIVTMDFEDQNFATFICGSARAGKSNLLHILLTGLIKYNHPDDIELWLIDFKMTEFSQYMENTPPHIRYILLDESPEMVYDIIDRLTEILIKRKNAFKGKWKKLDYVPEETYMPALLVMIDEFSIMSQIIADSVKYGKEDYSLKLQALLAEGAALGMHFIFSNQGFTSGSRGLSDFAKQQVQQRVAMHSEYNEIRQTLDLRTVSNRDQQMMEQLPQYHALIRVPITDGGNHLKQVQVLYLSDMEKQEKLIKKINTTLHIEPRYNVKDTMAYIDKKTTIVNGDTYDSFVSKQSAMVEYIEKNRAMMENDMRLFPGEARRMHPLYPIEIANTFCENILVVANPNEKMAATSVIMSIAKSLEIFDTSIDVWTGKKNDIYRQMVLESHQEVRKVSRELEDVCGEIRRIKKLINERTVGNRYIVLCGMDTMVEEMAHQKELVGDSERAGVFGANIGRRKSGEKDWSTLLKEAMAGNKEGLDEMESSEGREKSVSIDDTLKESLYDARKDLEYIFTHGPRYGYHFIVVFQTSEEFKHCKFDTSLFKHKILFRMSKNSAIEVAGMAGAEYITQLKNHTFRYTNGIETVSFRPYLHEGLSWDGWKLDKNGAKKISIEEDEYLM